MNFLYNHFVHGVVALGAVASLGLGGSVAAHNLQANADTKAHVEVEGTATTNNQGDKGDIKHPSVKPAGGTIIIGANGHVLVHGATVTAVSSGSVGAKSTIGASTVNWTLNTASAKPTDNNEEEDGTSTQASVVVGDSINFAGTLSSTAAFGVDASVLHDTTR